MPNYTDIFETLAVLSKSPRLTDHERATIDSVISILVKTVELCVTVEAEEQGLDDRGREGSEGLGVVK